MSALPLTNPELLAASNPASDREIQAMFLHIRRLICSVFFSPDISGLNMAINYTEKRKYFRMETSHKINYQPEGSDQMHEGQCLNLSAAGVLFTSHRQYEPGTRISINITPTYSIVKPLHATIEVIRSQINNAGVFATAGEIREMH